MQHLPSLLILLIVQTPYLSHYKATASPLSIAVESDNDNATSYYEGYPEREELEKYSLYLLGHLQGSRALSTVNLALWNQHFRDEEQACAAVQQFLGVKQRTESHRDSSRGCQATYQCDYDPYRFPSTIINIACDASSRGYCQTTQDSWQVRGTCLGDQYYLTTLKFVRDPTPQPSEVEGASEVESVSGDGDRGMELRPEDMTGRWTFRTSLMNKACLCLS